MEKKYNLIMLIPAVMAFSLTACNKKGIINVDDNNHLFKQVTKDFNKEHSSVNQSYVNSLNNFAIDFFSKVHDKENKIFSPLSIATAFYMLLDGADNSSKEEIEKLLHYDNSFNHLNEIKNMHLATSMDINDNEGNRVAYLDVNESFFVDETFKDEILDSYVNTLADYYFAEAYHGNLMSNEMHELLASWINNKTNDFFDLKGKDFEDFAGVLWLVNTLYLKAQWQYEFKEYAGKDVEFYNIDNTTSNINYISGLNLSCKYFDNSQYSIASIPLKGNLNFNVLLPKDKTDYNQVLFDEKASSDLLDPEHKLSKSFIDDIYFKIPVFKNTMKYDLKDVFVLMGISDIFDGAKADFSRISPSAKEDGLHVEKAIHQAGIDLNKDGIEATAFTIIEIEKSSSSIEDVMKFEINRPFLYTITNQNNLPLFVGNVSKL